MIKGKVLSFTDLKVWQKGHNLVMMIYEIVKDFPKDELFGLTIQLRRAVVSITSNIAEGFGRQSVKEKVQFYCLARASLTEVQNQILIARDAKYIDNKIFHDIAKRTVEVHKMLNALIKSKRNKGSKS